MASKPKPKRNKKYVPKYDGTRLPDIFRNRELEEKAAWTGYAEFMKLEARIADERSWNLLTGRLNMGSRYSEYFAEENGYGAIMLKALDAVVAIQHRSPVHGYVAGDNELENIRMGLVLTQDMQSRLSQKQINEALQYVIQTAAIFGS